MKRFSSKTTKNKGVVLITIILLLGIMSLIGAITMKNSALTEQMTNNFRTASVAQQAAEVAIKYCEAVATDSASINFATDRSKIMATTITGVITSGAWNTSTTWNVATNYISVNNAFSQSTNSSAKQFNNPPQCIIERLDGLAGKGFVVTARGFGNDAVINATNGVTSGSEAWSQSVLIE